MTNQELLDIKQIIVQLGVSDSTIRRAVKDGKLKAYRIGKRLKFKSEDVDRFVKSQVVAPKSASQDAYQEMRQHTDVGKSDSD